MAEPDNQLDFWRNGTPQSAETGHFRPIHYIGSKLRVVDLVCSAVDDLDPSSGNVCDLFAGSGTVSMALAKSRRVTAVDIQEYSRTICSALLRPHAAAEQVVTEFLEEAKVGSAHLKQAIEPLIDLELSSLTASQTGQQDDLCDLVEHGSILGFQLGERSATTTALSKAMERSVSRLRSLALESSEKSLVARYFGGIYFSYSQAADLDSLLSAAFRLPVEVRDFFLAVILSTASSTANTIGKQFAQPIRPRDSTGRPKLHLVDKIRRDREAGVFPVFLDWFRAYTNVEVGHPGNVAVRSDYSMLGTYAGDLSVIYADPPYTRDHYSRFYHVLETMCLRDNPEVSTVRIRGQDRLSRGLYRVGRHQSPFCIRSQAPAAFRELFSMVSKRRIPLVLSYSPDTDYEGARPRVMTLDAIRQIALEHFNAVDIENIGAISHSKLNHSSRILGEAGDAEVLFICRP